MFELDLHSTPEGKSVSGVPVINEQKMSFTDSDANAFFNLPPSVIQQSDIGGEQLIENIMSPEEKAKQYSKPTDQSSWPDIRPWGPTETPTRKLTPEQKEMRKTLKLTGPQAENIIEQNVPVEETKPLEKGFRQVKTNTIIESLVSLADKFDGEGNFDLAAEVDQTIEVLASRPKAPLHHLKDDVKKSLIVFLGKAHNNMTDSVYGLNELFRRLRYFDIADSIKDLGLDRVVKDMEKTQSCLDSAQKDFYTMTYGKRPSKSDIEELLGRDGEADDGQAALDFFSANSDFGHEEDLVKENEEEAEDITPFVDEVEVEEDDDDDEILEGFWDDEEGEDEEV